MIKKISEKKQTKFPKLIRFYTQRCSYILISLMLGVQPSAVCSEYRKFETYATDAKAAVKYIDAGDPDYKEDASVRYQQSTEPASPLSVDTPFELRILPNGSHQEVDSSGKLIREIAVDNTQTTFEFTYNENGQLIGITKTFGNPGTDTPLCVTFDLQTNRSILFGRNGVSFYQIEMDSAGSGTALASWHDGEDIEKIHTITGVLAEASTTVQTPFEMLFDTANARYSVQKLQMSGHEGGNIGLYKQSESFSITTKNEAWIRILGMRGEPLYNGPGGDIPELVGSPLAIGHYFVETIGDRTQFLILPDDYAGASFLGPTTACSGFPFMNASNSATQLPWTIIGAVWATTQPTRDTFDWSATDRYLTLNPGMRFNFRAYVPAPDWVSSEEFIDRFADFVKAAVERYGSRIASVSVFNEPYLLRDVSFRFSVGDLTGTFDSNSLSGNGLPDGWDQGKLDTIRERLRKGEPVTKEEWVEALNATLPVMMTAEVYQAIKENSSIQALLDQKTVELLDKALNDRESMTTAMTEQLNRRILEAFYPQQIRKIQTEYYYSNLPKTFTADWPTFSRFYVDLVHAVRTAIQPSHIDIYGPSFNDPFLIEARSMEEAGLNDWIDGFNWHDYRSKHYAPDANPDWPLRLDKILDFYHSLFPGKKLMIDELGVFSGPTLGIEYEHPAEQLWEQTEEDWYRSVGRTIKQIVMLRGGGVDVILPHMLNLYNPNSSLAGWEMGVIARGPKPTTSSLLMTGYWLEGATFVEKRIRDDKLFLYAWRRADGTSMAFAWTTEGNDAGFDPAGLPQATDIFGTPLGIGRIGEEPVLFQSSTLSPEELLFKLDWTIGLPNEGEPVLTNQTIQFRMDTYDAEGNALTYTISNLPSGASMDNGLFTWRPTQEQAGTYALRVLVRNGKNETKKIIRIRVIDREDLGVLTSWNFDRTGGSAGATVNGAVSTQGRSGQALAFDGTNDYLIMPNYPDSEIVRTGFSTSFWIKTNSAAVAYHRVFTMNDSNNTFFRIYYAHDPPGYAQRLIAEVFINKILIATWGGGIPNNPQINDNIWRQFMFTFDGQNIVAYINGEKVQGGSGIGAYFGLPADHSVILGTSHPSDLGGFKGTLDEVMIFNKFLDQDEVTALYNDIDNTLDTRKTQLLAIADNAIAQTNTTISNLNKEAEALETATDANIGDFQKELAQLISNVTKLTQDLQDLSTGANASALTAATQTAIREYLAALDAFLSGTLDEQSSDFTEYLRSPLTRLQALVNSWNDYVSDLNLYRQNIVNAQTLQELETLNGRFPTHDDPPIHPVSEPPDPRTELRIHLSNGGAWLATAQNEIRVYELTASQPQIVPPAITEPGQIEINYEGLENAEAYQVQISKNQDFTDIVHEGFLAGTRERADISSAGTYYVRVRGSLYSQFGMGPLSRWSDTATLEIKNPPQSKPLQKYYSGIIADPIKLFREIIQWHPFMQNLNDFMFLNEEDMFYARLLLWVKERQHRKRQRQPEKEQVSRIKNELDDAEKDAWDLIKMPVQKRPLQQKRNPVRQSRIKILKAERQIETILNKSKELSLDIQPSEELQQIDRKNKLLRKSSPQS